MNFPIPNLTHIIEQLDGANYFIVVDLSSGFHQIPLRKEDRKFTAFSTSFGHFQYARLPFGMKNAPATFQQQNNKVVRQRKGMFIYIADIIIAVTTLDELDRDFLDLADRLAGANMRLHPGKTRFYQEYVTYLGYVIMPDLKKLKAIAEYPTPGQPKQIKQFLNVMKANHLFDLTKKNKTFTLDGKAQTVFDTLKNCLISEPILRHPDFTKYFYVTSDACLDGIGGYLSQIYEGIHHPVSYASRVLTDTETRYSTIERELLAMLYWAQQFRYGILGRRFTFLTDHRPLVWLHSVKDSTLRIKKWYFKLTAVFDFEIRYIPGKTNYIADALSKNPLSEPTLSVNIIRKREDAFSESNAEAILLLTKRKQPNDDMILYQKHASVAVRNEEGTFFRCKLMQDVHESAGKIKVRWYSEVKGDKHLYRLDYLDHIQLATILMNVSLK